ncbi:MAG TPA: hypothetical protein VFM54_18140 [Micromonosporaceae bacterium]|nr:hypothetical protein [Micromonosporaceae bacterium]
MTRPDGDGWQLRACLGEEWRWYVTPRTPPDAPGAGWPAGSWRGISGCRRAGHGRFTALAERGTERPTGIVVEPYLSGRGAPSPDPARRFAVHGVQPRHPVGPGARPAGRALPARAMDGDGHGARTRERVMAAGGPTRDRVWMRVKAAVGPAALAVVDGPDAACAGAALMAARSGLGWCHRRWPPPGSTRTLRRRPGTTVSTETASYLP